MSPQENCSSLDESSDDGGKQKRKRSSDGKTSRLEKGSDEYNRRRERNNLAVKKSRNKTKVKMQETFQRVTQLKQENEMLETKIKLLTKELSFLKDLFLAHAGNAHGQHLTETDLGILNNNNEMLPEHISQSVKEENC